MNFTSLARRSAAVGKRAGALLLGLRLAPLLCPAKLRPGGVRSHCRFRHSGAKYVSASGMKWMSGGTKRQCDRALRPGRLAAEQGRRHPLAALQGRTPHERARPAPPSGARGPGDAGVQRIASAHIPESGVCAPAAFSCAGRTPAVQLGTLREPACGCAQERRYWDGAAYVARRMTVKTVPPAEGRDAADRAQAAAIAAYEAAAGQVRPARARRHGP